MKSEKLKQRFIALAEQELEFVRTYQNCKTNKSPDELKLDLKCKYQKIIHRLLICEYGFNYQLEMEFDQLLFEIYKMLENLAELYILKEYELIRF